MSLLYITVEEDTMKTMLPSSLPGGMMSAELALQPWQVSVWISDLEIRDRTLHQVRLSQTDTATTHKGKGKNPLIPIRVDLHYVVLFNVF